MKRDFTTTIYKKAFAVEIDDKNANKIIKAVILNFGSGDIIVYNDNFNTRRKYADFTQGKKAANLPPPQIVFSGFDIEKTCNGRYLDKNDNIKYFKDL